MKIRLMKPKIPPDLAFGASLVDGTCAEMTALGRTRSLDFTSDSRRLDSRLSGTDLSGARAKVEGLYSSTGIGCGASVRRRRGAASLAGSGFSAT